jgi:imidazole glycerol-phosphate synthase subunit HisH
MIAIVDYNAGNLRSVKRACDAAGIASTITRDPAEVSRAERVIFPGVGAAPSAMESLRPSGLDQALRDAFAAGKPILGICLGCQIVLERSEEGDVETLGIFPGTTKLFRLPDPALKIPHIGWNEVRVVRPHPLLEGVDNGDAFYFVHSYYPQPLDEADVFARTDYGISFPSAVGRRNLFATQFHPEKSGKFGLRILERFAKWNGTIED